MIEHWFLCPVGGCSVWHFPSIVLHGPLARYVRLRVTHAPGMPGTFSPPLRVSDPDMHHGTCVTHVPWYMPRSLTNGFLWSRWRGKRSRHSRRMRNPRFYVSGKRSIAFLSSFERGAKLINSGLILTWSKSFDYVFFTKMPRAIVPNHVSNLIWELDG